MSEPQGTERDYRWMLGQVDKLIALSRSMDAGSLRGKYAIDDADDISPEVRQRFETLAAAVNEAVERISSKIEQSVEDIRTFVFSLETVNANVAHMNVHFRTISDQSSEASVGTGNVLAQLRAVSDKTGRSREAASSAEQESTVIGSVLEKGADSVKQIAETVDGVAVSAEQMSTAIGSVASSIEQMSASLSEVSRNSASAASTAREANDAARTTNSKMSELGKSAKSISKVVEMIKSIASQTNLLALNATIEAASAGEAGKGFAVVAGEVKALAKQTALATESIRDQVEIMQSQTSEAIRSIEDISMRIEQISDISNVIAAAVEEQTATTNEIARTIVHTALSTSEIDSRIRSSVGEARGVVTAVSEAVQRVGRNNLLIREVSREINEAARTVITAVDELDGVSNNVHTVSEALSLSVNELDEVGGSSGMLLELAGILESNWH